MNKINYFIIFLAACMAMGFTFDNEYRELSNPKSLLSKLQELSDATSTIEASFNETKYIAVLSEPQKATGKMYYKKQDKMKWVQQTPFEYIILINGEELRIKDNGKEKSFDEGGKVASRINKFMMGLIQGDYQNNSGYASRFLESTSDYLIELTPKVKSLSKVYSKLELYFSKKDYRLKRMIFFEAGGDKREVEFYNQLYNKTIDNKVFQNL